MSCRSTAVDIVKVFRAGGLVVTFNESWNELIAVNPDGTLAFNVPASRFAYNAGVLVRSTGGNVLLSPDNGATWTSVYRNPTGDQRHLRGPVLCVDRSKKQHPCAEKPHHWPGPELHPQPPADEPERHLPALWVAGRTSHRCHGLHWMYSLNNGETGNSLDNFVNPGIEAFDVIEQFPEWPVAYGVGNDMVRSDDNGASHTINRGIGADPGPSLERNGIETALFAGVDSPARPLYRSLNGGTELAAGHNDALHGQPVQRHAVDGRPVDVRAGKQQFVLHARPGRYLVAVGVPAPISRLQNWTAIFGKYMPKAPMPSAATTSTEPLRPPSRRAACARNRLRLQPVGRRVVLAHAKRRFLFFHR